MKLNLITGLGFFFIGLFLLLPVSHSKDLGHYGQVFPVIEADLRELIMKRLTEMQESGALLKHQRLIEQRVAEHIIRPKPLTLAPTKTPKTFRIDPTVLVSHDVALPDGTLIAKKGTAINPFNHLQFSKTLIFFNADDANQMAWVKKHYNDYHYVKFILISGDIRQASEHFGRIYFDLEGRITSQLHIKHVPSVVSQDGLYWKVVEIGVNDE
ncbi:type-F conjugative transfer system protein TraW [Legionella drozanskii]|uniref:Putative conjugative transfer protein TraW n=1 Tax=Legionella drozanskii LLAP-1 TaxID=1212489 RepID=A0A0W0SXI4_9GAMM|nr:type-F conjugative transfer system protein TraW [Legionella drozanskii]KTC87653.1 putative conjugative transfer protein TraW [Legionella drozanskii LLAP-1]